MRWTFALSLALLCIACGNDKDGDCNPATEGICSEPTADAGKPCTDVSECEGWCEPPEGAQRGAEVTGACSARTSASCMRWVENGRYEVDVCS